MLTVTDDSPLILYVDLFCGAGGFTSGVEDSYIGKRKMAKVIAAVNHDPFSIKSHRANHKGVMHFNEDIRTLNMDILVAHVKQCRLKWPNALLAMQAGLECTHFSRASGGQSKDASSRTLAEYMYKYIEALDPDIILIENVQEFLTYGPLRIKCKSSNDRFCTLAIEHKKDQPPSYVFEPDKKLKGTYYSEWRDTIKNYGYDYQHRILNCADYGLRTIRKRLFIQFVKHGMPTVWPKQTHSKAGINGLKKWLPVRPLLDLSDTGMSMFDEARRFRGGSAYKRVLKGGLYFYCGLKGAANEQYVKKYIALASKRISCFTPPTVINEEVNYILQYYSNGGDLKNIDEPGPAVAGKDQMHKVHTKFINHSFTSGRSYSGIDDPFRAVLPKPKAEVVSMTSNWMYDDQFGNNVSMIDNPSGTIIASQHKKPLKLISISYGDIRYPVVDNDCVEKIALKLFMIDCKIYDIMIRSLNIKELLRIQDFRGNYKLFGNESHKKKMIGNAVPCGIAKKIVAEQYKALLQYQRENVFLIAV